MLILAVMHECIYCAVYIINEEKLLLQICGLHKESKGLMGKRSFVEFFYIVLLVMLLAVLLACFLSNAFYCEME